MHTTSVDDVGGLLRFVWRAKGCDALEPAGLSGERLVHVHRPHKVQPAEGDADLAERVDVPRKGARNAPPRVEGARGREEQPIAEPLRKPLPWHLVEHMCVL